MRHPFLNRPGIRLARLASIAALPALLLAGCLYSFTGGGLPGHIRTVAIEPFENNTAQPILASDAMQQLRTELPRKLGVRLTDARAADAIIRGSITGYQEATTAFGTTGGEVNPDQMQVRISFEAEIYDLREDRAVWKQGGLSAVGNFSPAREQAQAGRARAIAEMVQRIVEGAQSQW